MQMRVKYLCLHDFRTSIYLRITANLQYYSKVSIPIVPDKVWMALELQDGQFHSKQGYLKKKETSKMRQITL